MVRKRISGAAGPDREYPFAVEVEGPGDVTEDAAEAGAEAVEAAINDVEAGGSTAEDAEDGGDE